MSDFVPKRCLHSQRRPSPAAAAAAAVVVLDVADSERRQLAPRRPPWCVASYAQPRAKTQWRRRHLLPRRPRAPVCVLDSVGMRHGHVQLKGRSIPYSIIAQLD